MAIRKQLIWELSKGKYSGIVDFGDEESPDLASEVLVFMVVSLNKVLKHVNCMPMRVDDFLKTHIESVNGTIKLVNSKMISQE